MGMHIRTGICLVALAAVTVGLGISQQTAGSKQDNASKQNTGTAQTSGQRKSGQVVHQDYNSSVAPMPNELTTLARRSNENGAQASGNGGGTQEAKIRVHQEFGPQQASRRGDSIAPSGSGSGAGKAKTDSAAQSPK